MLQEQLNAARREAGQLQAENEELREAHLERQSALQVQPGAAWLSALRSVDFGTAAGLVQPAHWISGLRRPDWA